MKTYPRLNRGILAAATLLCGGMFLLPTAALAFPTQARVMAVSGDAVVTAPGAKESKKLQVGMMIALGSLIKTGPDGSAVLALMPGATSSVQPGTSVMIQKLDFEPRQGGDQRKVELDLKEGSVLSKLQKGKPEDSDFKINTPHGVAAARGTEWLVALEGGQATVKVDNGVVSITLPNGQSVNVSPGQQSSASGGTTGAPTVSQPTGMSDADRASLQKAVNQAFTPNTTITQTANPAATAAIIANVPKDPVTNEPVLTQANVEAAIAAIVKDPASPLAKSPDALVLAASVLTAPIMTPTNRADIIMAYGIAAANAVVLSKNPDITNPGALVAAAGQMAATLIGVDATANTIIQQAASTAGTAAAATAAQNGATPAEQQAAAQTASTNLATQANAALPTLQSGGGGANGVGGNTGVNGNGANTDNAASTQGTGVNTPLQTDGGGTGGTGGTAGGFGSAGGGGGNPGGPGGTGTQIGNTNNTPPTSGF